MRPPLSAGEIRWGPKMVGFDPWSFNEAPAERGGNHRHRQGHGVAQEIASMRPPLSAGEIIRSFEDGAIIGQRFNEAPAERGGNPAKCGTTSTGRSSFNEAPAERGGNPPSVKTCPALYGVASMRPPLSAGEILPEPVPAATVVVASMRPPLSAGEINEKDLYIIRKENCFNEAPAERGGNPLGQTDVIVTDLNGFNEAPAERGGNRFAQANHAGGGCASMRPPLSAGEISNEWTWRTTKTSLQ